MPSLEWPPKLGATTTVQFQTAGQAASLQKIKFRKITSCLRIDNVPSMMNDIEMVTSCLTIGWGGGLKKLFANQIGS